MILKVPAASYSCTLRSAELGCDHAPFHPRGGIWDTTDPPFVDLSILVMPTYYHASELANVCSWVLFALCVLQRLVLFCICGVTALVVLACVISPLLDICTCVTTLRYLTAGLERALAWMR